MQGTVYFSNHKTWYASWKMHLLHDLNLKLKNKLEISNAERLSMSKKTFMSLMKYQDENLSIFLLNLS